MTEVDLVFFDMDHTLLDMDCDLSWKEFLVDEGLAPPADKEEARRYLELYHQGISPVEEFLQFQLREFIGRTLMEMERLAQRHFEERVSGHVFPQAIDTIAGFTQREIPTALLTGTNNIISTPIAEKLGIRDILATELAVVDGRFTGGIEGPYLSKEGKVEKALDFCRKMNTEPVRCAFFADSINDLPMLERAGRPVTVNPKPNLLEIAQSRNWEIQYWDFE